MNFVSMYVTSCEIAPRSGGVFRVWTQVGNGFHLNQNITHESNHLMVLHTVTTLKNMMNPRDFFECIIRSSTMFSMDSAAKRAFLEVNLPGGIRQDLYPLAVYSYGTLITIFEFGKSWNKL